jgi:hypothetical protein
MIEFVGDHSELGVTPLHPLVSCEPISDVSALTRVVWRMADALTKWLASKCPPRWRVRGWTLAEMVSVTRTPNRRVSLQLAARTIRTSSVWIDRLHHPLIIWQVLSFTLYGRSFI